MKSPAPNNKTPRDARSPTRSLRILVVENHPDMRRGLEVFLNMLGHRARFAVDMRTALEAVESEEKFDVLLSDIGLPDGNGWELLRRLEQMGRRPPHAIAMSGYGNTTDMEKSREAGFRRHLIKPGPPAELEAALREVALL
jgi:CheY-like chemotaxis protein